MEAPLLHKNLPCAYPLDGKLQVKDVPAPLIAHFMKFTRSPLVGGDAFFSKKSTLNFVHIL